MIKNIVFLMSMLIVYCRVPTNIDFPYVFYTFFNTEVVRRKSFCMFFFLPLVMAMCLKLTLIVVVVMLCAEFD